jgi:hypothetical protein
MFILLAYMVFVCINLLISSAVDGYLCGMKLLQSVHVFGEHMCMFLFGLYLALHLKVKCLILFNIESSDPRKEHLYPF